MEKTRSLWSRVLGAALGALLPALASASDAADRAGGGGVAFSGFIESVNRFLLDGGAVDSSRNSFGLKAAGGGERIRFLAEAVLELPGFSEFADIADLGARSLVEPFELRLNEAYVDLYGFPFKSMDTRVGKQIVVWGKGDKINPTSNLSPPDLTDLFDFGNRLGIQALQTNLYAGGFTLTAVFSPVFTPALLPGDYLKIAGLGGIPPAANVVDKPPDTLGKGSSLAAKLAFAVGGFDVSLSYAYCRSPLPAVYEIAVDPASLPSIVPVATKSRFPRRHVVGADASGELLGLGVWGEGALFLPAGYIRRTVTDPESVVLETRAVDEPYLRYVAGLDYTFRSGLYLNLQFAHGLDLETEKDLLGDYLTLRVEKKLSSDRLTLVPLSLVIGTEDWRNISGHFGVGYGPELRYYPSDAVEIGTGAFLIHGEGNTFLSRLKDLDSVFLRVKASF